MRRAENNINFNQFKNLTPTSMIKIELTAAGFFIYSPSITELWKDKKFTEFGLLMVICRDMKFGYNTIEITAQWRKDIMSELNISKSKISDGLKYWISRGFIADSDKKGFYIVNPYLIFKGRCSNREALLSLTEKLSST